MTRLEDVLPDRRAASVWGAGHRVACLLGVLVLSVGPTVAGAHHSFAICTDEVTEVEGELVDVHWGNPHVRLTIHAEESGRETVWNLETGNPYVLQRRGLPRELFQPGDRIRVAGRVHREQATRSGSRGWTNSPPAANRWGCRGSWQHRIRSSSATTDRGSG